MPQLLQVRSAPARIPLDPATAGNRLLAALPPAALASLAPHLESVLLTTGQILLRPDVPVQYAWFPSTAVAAVAVDSTDEVSILGRDGFVGWEAALGDDRVAEPAVVRIGGFAHRIAADTLRRARLDLPVLRSVLDRYLHASVVAAVRTASCGRSHLLAPRLASLLLWLRDQTDSDRLNLTHEQLARMLGVSRRASVTESMRTLAIQGLVEVHRSGVSLGASEAVDLVSCGCYRRLRSAHDHAMAQRGAPLLLATTTILS